ncbi:MAG: PDZ domain-containing protein [Phycisphaerae bacterium]
MARTAALALIAISSTVTLAAPQKQSDERNANRKQDTPDAKPSTWIGLRLAPIPEALAAHVGERGMMVANVAEDSPADAAGIERYDVILKCEGKAIDAFDAFVSTIERVGAGNSVELTLLRGGKEQTVRAKLAARPENADVKFKYEEPQESDDTTRYFGHTLRKDPFGNWILEPLGRLNQLPDALKDPNGPAWRQWNDAMRQFQLDPYSFNVQVDPNGSFFFDHDADADEHSQMNVTITHDGQTISIARDSDGKMTVTREKDGKKTEKSYNDADALRKGDPEAYHVFRGQGMRSQQFFVTPPSNLPRAQQQFRNRLESRMRALQDQADSLRRDAAATQKEARRAYERATKDPRAGRNEVKVEKDEKLNMTVENGRVSVTVERDGKTKSYEFDSMADFRRELPDVYEKLVPAGDDDDDSQPERSDASQMLSQVIRL